MEKATDNLSTSLHQLMQLIPGEFFCYDVDYNQEFMFINDSMPGMFGYTMEEFRAKFNNRFPDMVYIKDRERVLSEIDSQTQNGDIDYCEYRVEMADGSLKWVYDRGRLVVDENGKRWFYVVIMDADELKAAEQRRHDHDAQLLNEFCNRTEWGMMTGILNYSDAATGIEKCIKKYHGGTLLFLDIDNFKNVNATKGHHSGDQLLAEIALSTRERVHPEETLARIDGDKFIIFMPGNYNVKTAEKRADEIIEDIREIMSHDIENGGCSIGISISNRADITFDEMFLQAKELLKQAKATGKNKSCMTILN